MAIIGRMGSLGPVKTMDTTPTRLSGLDDPEGVVSLSPGFAEPRDSNNQSHHTRAVTKQQFCEGDGLLGSVTKNCTTNSP